MREVIITLICLSALICCKDKGTDSLATKIQDYSKGLKKTKEIKFGGGDVWGTTYIYNNQDSSVTKVLVDYDAGDYGKGRNEYLIVDNIVVYQKDSIVDWVIVKSPLDSNQYKLRETISYVNGDSTGTKISKAIYSTTLEFSDEKKRELQNVIADSITLTKSDYIKMHSELKDALGRAIIVE
jgi:hypothetical protein